MNGKAPSIKYDEFDLNDGKSILDYSIKYYEELKKALGEPIDRISYSAGTCSRKPKVQGRLKTILLEEPKDEQEKIKTGAVLYLIGKARSRVIDINLFDCHGNAVITTRHTPESRKTALQRTLDSIC